MKGTEEIKREIQEFEKDERKKVVIDIRSEGEYKQGSIRGAVNIPKENLEEAMDAGAGYVAMLIGEALDAQRQSDDMQDEERTEVSGQNIHPADLEDNEHVGETVIGENFLGKEGAIYLLCRTGEACSLVAEKMQQLGFFCYSFKGGYMKLIEDEIAKVLEDDECRTGRQIRAQRSLITKFRKSIWRPFVKAVQDYELIKDGDRIAVCISGGKDSMLMAKLFQELSIHGIQNFEVRFLVMDPGYNPANRRRIEDNARLLGIPVEVFDAPIFDAVESVEESPCYLCARMRRGYLYAKAQELGCNKIALGHHFDDVIETILMGMLYGGQVQTMMPKLHSIHFEGMELIRPLYYVREADILRWRDYNDLHFIACACKITERGGGEYMDSKRGRVKALIRELTQENEFVEKNIFRSVENVNLATIISYKDEGKVHHFLDDYDKKGNIHQDEQ